MDTFEQNCQLEKIAAYLDFQLDESASSQFEAHVKECGTCRAELNAQRQFMCELDSLLTNSNDIPIPQNFARVVSARAESDMRGLRARPERRRAFLICVALAATAFALLGVAAGRSLLGDGRLFVNKVWVVFGLLWTALYDACMGLIILLRVVSRMFWPESSRLSLVAALLLALAVVSLSHLIVRYHRRNQVRLFE